MNNLYEISDCSSNELRNYKFIVNKLKSNNLSIPEIIKLIDIDKLISINGEITSIQEIKYTELNILDRCDNCPFRTINSDCCDPKSYQFLFQNIFDLILYGDFNDSELLFKIDDLVTEF